MVDEDGGYTYACMADGDCQGSHVRCDDAADCTGDELCCGEIVDNQTLTGRCEMECANDPEQPDEPRLCQTAAECGPGGTCNEYTCPLIGKVKACLKPIGCN